MFYKIRNRVRHDVSVVILSEDCLKRIPISLKSGESVKIFQTQITENVHRLISEGLIELVIYTPANPVYEYETLETQIKKSEESLLPPPLEEEEPKSLINKIKTRKSKKN